MRKCPRCGHENVPRAVYCFQCGRDLEEPPVVRGVHGTGTLVEDALRFIKERGHTLEPSKIERLQQAKVKVPPADLEGEPLTCLRCGGYNRPQAAQCADCGAPLIVPDLDSRLIVHPAAFTNVGRVRTNNEDNVNLWALEGVVLAVVADGMGGAAAGEEASRLAVEAVQADFLGDARGSQDLQVISESDLNRRLTDAVLDANRAVKHHADADSSRKGMGTTITMALVRGNRAMIAHVGDSRAYLIDGSEHAIQQITDDHSFVQALVASGHITPEQAKLHPMGNVLYRALGQSYDLDVDLYSRYLKAGDRILLCSDGLTRHLRPDDIATIMFQAKAPDEAARNLIEMANSRGGEDNISVAILMIDAEQPGK